jgi:UDP-N-acetylmuramyl pentapeptide synthase
VLLSELLQAIPGADPALKNRLRGQAVGVTSDSREVAPGVVFVAVRGGARDGHEFVAQALASGAALVVGEAPVEALATHPQASPATRLTSRSKTRA